MRRCANSISRGCARGHMSAASSCRRSMSSGSSMNGCTLNWRASKAAAVLGLALCASACGGRHAAAPAMPPGEDAVLHIYNWADYIGHDTVAEFERETHI